MIASSKGRVVAFFDLGTNSVRLLVACFESPQSYTVLTKQKEVVRLGEGAFIRGWLRDDAMDRAVLVCRRFVDLSRSFGAVECVAVATSAVREARNSADFLKRLQNETGLNVRTVSGVEEARLIYLGVSRGIEMGDAVALFVDIGGGSTEIIVGDRGQERMLESLHLGAIRLTNQFFEDGATDSVPPEVYEEIRRYIRDVVTPVAERVKRERVDVAYGSSGTIQNLAEIARRSVSDRLSDTPPALTREDLGKTAALLCSLPLDRRKGVPGINPDRADIIIAGTAILEEVMDAFGLSEIRISDRGLRDGLIVDYLSRRNGMSPEDRLRKRKQSVERLLGACRASPEHAQTVARFSLELFDSGRQAGLHKFGTAERELLEYAAYLHDIGEIVSFSNHHLHSHYIISNADLPGFDRREVGIIAEVARYHRKKPPRTGTGPAAVPALSVFLRLAEHLDRGHVGLVAQARIVSIDKKAATLEIVSATDCTLESSAIRSEGRAFRRVFGKDLIIRCVGSE
ncbi:Ppx/GppA phosphatase family protein [Methanoculleus palmolei]|jgi:exopolyphosphatase/guanosine-5'-triphosphate,3'-diphosphate pyrophosphatase|uniref:Ppx/GppA phosphatase family protein n=1 Tax=Methanoculleus palmolei TaxID=72612 RepID=A0ABD8A8T2_9EURY|nr:Ppx/GppA phosphatase family protein [Methanoculleus sp. UBA377]WOX55941.1 Ppx/GppA phosphatase family protein [Methanoculleus palmolei]